MATIVHLIITVDVSAATIVGGAREDNGDCLHVLIARSCLSWHGEKGPGTICEH